MAATLTDSELLARMQVGDEEAFVTLYRRRQGGVYRFALHMSGSESIAEDVTQEVFMAIARNSGRFDPDQGSVAAYLTGIARNHVLRRIEKNRVYVPLETESVGEAAASVAPCDPFGDLTRSETVARVRQAITVLPPHYREVVVLCDLQEMNYADAADALGCAVGTVRSRLHRARGMLVERLRATEEPDPVPEGTRTKRCFA